MEATSQASGLGTMSVAHGIWEECADTKIMNCARVPVSHVAGVSRKAQPAGAMAATALATKERGTRREAAGMSRKFTIKPMGCAW